MSRIIQRDPENKDARGPNIVSDISDNDGGIGDFNFFLNSSW